MKHFWAGGLVGLGLLAANADAQTVTLLKPVALEEPATPVVQLQKPVPLPAAPADSAAPRRVVRAQNDDIGHWDPMGTGHGSTLATPAPAHGRIVQVAGPPPAPPPDPFFPAPPPPGGMQPMPPGPGSFGAGDACWGFWGNPCAFRSDHCFDYFISPVTNPFLFEDPRSLTEVRPLFLLQTIPESNPLFGGGNIEYLGVQGRLAITDRISLVFTKLGGIFLNPDENSPIDSNSGFAELWLGPKFTFLRNENSGTIAAAGLQFQLPTGSSKVFQDTGTLSLVPYASIAQNFCRSSYGSFNTMGTVGYSFGMDNDRTDQFFLSLHLDYDVGNFKKFYPLLELNWFNYPQAGTVRDFGMEGRDLINFGSTGVSGHNLFTIAAGARYKFTEATQMGAAVEFPLGGQRDLFDFRLTLDFIWRY